MLVFIIHTVVSAQSGDTHTHSLTIEGETANVRCVFCFPDCRCAVVELVFAGRDLHAPVHKDGDRNRHEIYTDTAGDISQS